MNCSTSCSIISSIFIGLIFTSRQASRKDTKLNRKFLANGRVADVRRRPKRRVTTAHQDRHIRVSHLRDRELTARTISTEPHSWCTWSSHQWSDRQKSVARRWLEGPKAICWISSYKKASASPIGVGPKAICWISSYKKASASPIGVGETPFAVYPCRLGFHYTPRQEAFPCIKIWMLKGIKIQLLDQW